MFKLEFSKWSPAGNTTLLFPASGLDAKTQALLASYALNPAILGAEQAGFTNFAPAALRMAGGEFCLNATRAFGALLDFKAMLQSRNDEAGLPVPEAPRQYQVRVSGWPAPIKLIVQGGLPCWQVDAALPLTDYWLENVGDNLSIVRLPGIVHLYVCANSWPENPESEASRLRRKFQLENEAACGIIWWRQDSKSPSCLEILPLVHVPKAGTSMIESACGSGSLGLALALHKDTALRSYKIRQPCGAYLDLSLEKTAAGSGLAHLGGDVALIAQGEVWLNLPNGIRPGME